jgi:hypothetical protein
MNCQAGVGATSLAAEAIAPDHARSCRPPKKQGMLAPVVTGAAAAQSFQSDMLAAGAEQSELARPSPLFEKLQAFHQIQMRAIRLEREVIIDRFAAAPPLAAEPNVNGTDVVTIV